MSRPHMRRRLEEGVARVNGIFVSYRRSDSAGWTGRLVAELSRRFAGTRLFVDIDAVAAGQDFRAAIDDALSTSRVVLVIIGPRWLEAVEGRRRLFDADDLVATEVARALATQPRPKVVRTAQGTKVVTASTMRSTSLAVRSA